MRFSNDRPGEVAPVVDDPIIGNEVDNAPDWDEEAMLAAEQQIKTMEGWDDDAAEFLRRTLRLARLKQRRDRPRPWDLPQMADYEAKGGRVYDPPRLYTRAMMVCGGLDWEKIDEMHYKSFFALCREIVIHNREQDEQFKKSREEARYGQGGDVDVRQFSPVVDKWEGNLHRLGQVEVS